MPSTNESNNRRPSHFAKLTRHDEQGQRPTPRQEPASGTSRPSGRRVADVPRTTRGATTKRISSRSAAVTRKTHGGATPRHRSGRDPRQRVLLAAIGAAVVLAVAAIIFFVVVPVFTGSDDSGTSQVASGQQVEVTIPEGSSTSSIAQILVDAGVITSSEDFLQAVQKQGVEQQLKSGSYTLLTGSSTDNVIDQLVEGPNSTASTITVPEGYTVSQVASLVEEKFGISTDDFLAQAKASNYVSDYAFLADAQDDSLEGFLFPKTYDFSGQTVTADLVIRTMLSQYQTEVASLDFESARSAIESRYGITMSDYDILTMASIIEKEALTEDDRPLIASVFYNRLSSGMQLQSDATLAYSLGREVTADDLTQDDPYNSYLNSGLTPTPICNPGLASIEAAMSPSDTNYYYFYITSDVHAFSETYEQHQQVIAENS